MGLLEKMLTWAVLWGAIDAVAWDDELIDWLAGWIIWSAVAWPLGAIVWGLITSDNSDSEE